MKKLMLGVIGVAAFGALAFAGLKGNYPVSINLTGHTATGGLATARSSTYSNQYIGCFTSVQAGSPTYYWGYCSANDGQGTSVMCTTTNPDLIAQMRTIGTDARVTFQWDDDFACTLVDVRLYSTQAPKAP